MAHDQLQALSALAGQGFAMTRRLLETFVQSIEMSAAKAPPPDGLKLVSSDSRLIGAIFDVIIEGRMRAVAKSGRLIGVEWSFQGRHGESEPTELLAIYQIDGVIYKYLPPLDDERRRDEARTCDVNNSYLCQELLQLLEPAAMRSALFKPGVP